MDNFPEILAPAGSGESLVAAARCGADAVYLGGKSLNARRGASNFSGEELADAVSYCHIRGIQVYLTLNTVVFDNEREELEAAIAEACRAGVDAVITQDMGVLTAIKRCAPDLPVHASTQMSVHNLDGVKLLEELGFSRVVLARELSREEIAHIAAHTDMGLEVFVHGALCMCVSGQCYLSSMIGGRSGNRGLCAQPCRLPFRSGGSSHALSLKDLSLVEALPELAALGVESFKIEGRLKRPEYVAAAVTACKQALAGEATDAATLAAVFSRSGFTRGYYDKELGDGMFGTRQKEDVLSSSQVLKELAGLYKDELRRVPVDFLLSISDGVPATLTVSDGVNTATAVGQPPQQAISAPTTAERARAALEKTGGTPYFAQEITCEIGEGLMVPASQLNALRREVLEKLSAQQGKTKEYAFSPLETKSPTIHVPKVPPECRVRVETAAQLAPTLWQADKVIIPLEELRGMDPALLEKNKDRIIAELPRIAFGDSTALKEKLAWAKTLGIRRAAVGNIGGVHLAREADMLVHGDYSLNAVNTLSLEYWERLGLSDLTLSFELDLIRIRRLGGGLPRGILAYGHLPLMITRNAPAGTQGSEAVLTDRLDNRFTLMEKPGATELLNTVPLYLADRLPELTGVDFLTLYFTTESAEDCAQIFENYRRGKATDTPKTRGLYYRKVQ